MNGCLTKSLTLKDLKNHLLSQIDKMRKYRLYYNNSSNKAFDWFRRLHIVHTTYGPLFWFFIAIFDLFEALYGDELHKIL